MTSPSNPYKSKLERRVAQQLRLQKVPFAYENILISYLMESTYVPDFVLDSGIVIEAKGYLRPEDRRKHLCIQRQQPHWDIRFVFENAYQTLNKKSAMTYAQWCDRHGFLWAHKTIPQEWIRK